MKVTVKLFASFRYGRFNSEIREYEGAVTGRDVALELGIPVEQVGIILHNGVHAKIDDPLRDGDTLAIMPQIGGG